MAVTAEQIADALIERVRNIIEVMRGKIVHCLEQLDDEDVNFRPFEGANSIANLIVHLCGSMSQWILEGVGGEPAGRNRPDEFARDLRRGRAQLLEALNAVTRRADEILAGLTAATLLEPRKIQGFDETILSAIFDSATHFEGHAYQIVYIARLRLRERYVFKWTPPAGS